MVGIDGPLDIDSQIRNIGNLSQGYGSTLSMPTLGMDGTQASGYAAMPQLNAPDYQNFFNTGSNALQANASAAQTAANAAYDRTASAYENMGSAFSDIVSSTGALLDEKFPDGIGGK